MELFKLFGSIALNNSGANRGIDETTGKAENASVKIGAAFEKIGSFAVKAGQTIAVGLAAGATAITALTKQSIDAYAEYEQLVGGVDTLFKQASDTVMTNASSAFKTAGMSANEYMNTVTSFSASLIQSLGGDTAAAADIANMAITDMSDNANKMGSDISAIQNAYQGFAKQNYTMLDNLKLGYGGTATEMARLINDSGVLGDKIIDLSDTQQIGAELAEVGFANMVKAINAVQTQMGITGTTAKEASSTIQGSVSMAKAAWTNLVTGMADENADLEQLVNDFVDSVGAAAENIIPRVEIALEGAGKLIDRLFPIIIDKVPTIINDVLPKILSSAANIVTSLVTGISQNKDTIFNTTKDCMMLIIDTITDLLPDIFELGMELVVTIAEGIIDNLDELIDSSVETVEKIVEIITEPKTLDKLLEAALKIIISLAEALVEALPNMVDSIIGIVTHIVDVITEEETLDKLLDASLAVIIAIAEGLVEFLPELMTAAVTLVDRLIEFILEEENLKKLINTALVLVNAILGGILNSAGVLTEGAQSIVSTIIEAIITTNWVEVGWDIVSGISQGIIDAWGDFVRKHPDTAKLWSNVATSFNAGGSDALVGTVNTIGGVTQVGVPPYRFNSHADGLDYVPYDGYLAELHKGEMVVPAADSRFLRENGIGAGNKELMTMLERILYALEENSTATVSLNINNREFARLVKAVN